MRQFLRTYWPTMLVAAAILYVSLLREPHFRMDMMSNMDKMMHFLAYAGLGVVMTIDLHRGDVSSLKRACWLLLFPTAFGGVIEILQARFFAPRTGDVLDWLADVSGALLAYVLTDLFYSRILKK